MALYQNLVPITWGWLFLGNAVKGTGTHALSHFEHLSKLCECSPQKCQEKLSLTIVYIPWHLLPSPRIGHYLTSVKAKYNRKVLETGLRCCAKTCYNAQNGSQCFAKTLYGLLEVSLLAKPSVQLRGLLVTFWHHVTCKLHTSRSITYLLHSTLNV